MMMISRGHSKRARKSTIQKVIVVSLFVALVAGFNLLRVNPFSGPTHLIGGAFWGAEDAVSERLRLFVELLRSKRSLAEENARLTEEAAAQEHLAIANEMLRAENGELKFLLGRRSAEDRVLAAVLSKPDVSPYDTLIIDTGTKDGIHVGDRVVALGDFVVGFVSNVYPGTAQVTFYSSPGQKTTVLIGEAGIQASAEGRGANNFVASLPRDADVKSGDIVTLAGSRTQVFAVVEEVVRNSTDAFQTVLFKNPVNVFTVGWVEVVRNSR